jgi:hypothetical protein
MIDVSEREQLRRIYAQTRTIAIDTHEGDTISLPASLRYVKIVIATPFLNVGR